MDKEIVDWLQTVFKEQGIKFLGYKYITDQKYVKQMHIEIEEQGYNIGQHTDINLKSITNYMYIKKGKKIISRFDLRK